VRRADRVAIIWEGDEPTEVKHITYGEALADTCRLANAYKTLGVVKGDRVCLYMVSMLAPRSAGLHTNGWAGRVI
jgi:acetyl-CoA synthetase